jgi:hypothetical protein
MLFEMLTGQSPFSGPTGEIVLHRRLTEEAQKVRTLSPDCPKSLDNVITRLLSRSVDERFQNAAELSEALSECIDEDDRRGTRPKTPIHSKATIVMNKAGAPTVVHATTRAAPKRKPKAKAKSQPNYMLWGIVAGVVVLGAVGVLAMRMLAKPAPTVAQAPTTVAQAPTQVAPPPSQPAVVPAPAPTPDTQAAVAPPVEKPAKALPKKQPVQEKPAKTPVRPQPAPVAATPPPTLPQPAPQAQQQVAQQPAPVTPAAPAPAIDLATEVRHANDVVNQYVAALNAKDINRMKQLYPTMPAALESGLRALTSNATDFSATMTTPPNASVLGDAGDTDFGYSMSFFIPSQGKSNPSFRYHAALARQGSTWQIKSLTLVR